MYSWLSCQKWERGGQGGFGKLRSEMQGTVAKVEVGTESGRAEYEG